MVGGCEGVTFYPLVSHALSVGFPSPQAWKIVTSSTGDVTAEDIWQIDATTTGSGADLNCHIAWSASNQHQLALANGTSLAICDVVSGDGRVPVTRSFLPAVSLPVLSSLCRVARRSVSASSQLHCLSFVFFLCCTFRFCSPHLC